jgi:hypothetical protein
VLVDLVQLIKGELTTSRSSLPSDLVPAIEEVVHAHFDRAVNASL